MRPPSKSSMFFGNLFRMVMKTVSQLLIAYGGYLFFGSMRGGPHAWGGFVLLLGIMLNHRYQPLILGT